MLARQEESIRKKTDKMEKAKNDQQDKENQEKENRRRAILDHISKPVPKHDMSWKQLEELNDLKRKEKAEKFKAEFALRTAKTSSAASFNANSIKEKHELMRKEAELKSKQERQFVAKDPLKVKRVLFIVAILISYSHIHPYIPIFVHIPNVTNY